MIYLFLIILCLILAYISKFKIVINHRRSYFFVILIIVLVTIVAGFRDYSVGTDTNGTYLEIYEFSKHHLSYIRDKGYGILNWVIYKTFGSYSAVLFFSALITYSLVFIRIIKSSKNLVFSTFLFFATDFFFITMNMVRQSIVIAMFIYSFPYINSDKKKDIIKYFIILIISISFHTVGIVTIPAFFLIRFLTKKRCINTKKSLIFTGINLLISTIVSTWLIKLIRSIPFINRYFGWYLASSLYKAQFSFFGFAIPMAIFIVMSFSYKKGKDNIIYRELYSCMLFAANIEIYSSFIPLIERIAMFFSSQVVIYLPEAIRLFSGRKRLAIEAATIVAYLLYMFITIWIQCQEGVLPYHFI